MSWEPTPEQVTRVDDRTDLPGPPEERGPMIERVLSAFVPEGTVPVFLTREQVAHERNVQDCHGVPDCLYCKSIRDVLDAALKESGE